MTKEAEGLRGESDISSWLPLRVPIIKKIHLNRLDEVLAACPALQAGSINNIIAIFFAGGKQFYVGRSETGEIMQQRCACG